jgi:hypothetical protein
LIIYYVFGITTMIRYWVFKSVQTNTCFNCETIGESIYCPTNMGSHNKYSAPYIGIKFCRYQIYTKFFMLAICGLVMGTILKQKTMDEVACNINFLFYWCVTIFQWCGMPFMGLTNMEAISSIGIYSLLNIPRTWFEVFFAIAICLLKLLTM